MSGGNGDAELEAMRGGVSCAVILERWRWRLDRRESTRRALKYRRGKGEVLIVNHDGRGWWDPTGTAKGDVFALVQHLDPGLNFGGVRRALRPLVGLAPAFAAAERRRRGDGPPPRPPAERWAARPPGLRPAGATWRYLAQVRGLPPAVLALAVGQDAVREGSWGTAWFAHRDAAGRVSHVEVRGPRFRRSLAGGEKALFRLAGPGRPLRRLAVAEAPIEALSLAALEGPRPGTLYLATGGGIGPGTEAALAALVAGLEGVPGAVLVAAGDADPAGERHAARVAAIAAGRLPCARLRPPEGADWNDLLRRGQRRQREGRGA